MLSQKLEHTGKLAVLLSMDKVKMRHPVVPGDQLLLEAVAVRVKSRTGHVRCKAFVEDKLACEADIKFMLVDAEPAVIGMKPGAITKTDEERPRLKPKERQAIALVLIRFSRSASSPTRCPRSRRTR